MKTSPIPADKINADLFWSRCNLGQDDECWPWQLKLDSDGYGKFHTQKKFYAAHRVAYTLAFGPIPDGLQLDHLCRNRSCINPSHLEAVSARVNTARSEGITAARAANWLVGKCGNGHELAAVGLHKQRNSWTCAQCGRDRVARYNQRKKRKASA